MNLRRQLLTVSVIACLSAPAFAADKYFADWNGGGDMGEYAFSVVKVPSVKKALQGVLDTKYKALADRLATTGPMERKGDVNCGSGLMAHNGGSEEAIFCLNHVTGEVQAGIMENRKITFYTGKAKPYAQLTAWQARIKENQSRFK